MITFKFCYFLLVCHDTLAAYFKYEVSVSIKLDQETPATTFPAVTFCNLNPFNTYHTDINSLMHSIMKKYNIDTRINVDLSHPMLQLEKLLYKLRIIGKTRYFENEVLGLNNTNLGFNIEDMLLNCEFDGIECDYSDFQKFYSYEYGNCFTFNINNGSGVKKVIRKKTGLILELFSGIPGKIIFLLTSA